MLVSMIIELTTKTCPVQKHNKYPNVDPITNSNTVGITKDLLLQINGRRLTELNFFVPFVATHHIMASL